MNRCGGRHHEMEDLVPVNRVQLLPFDHFHDRLPGVGKSTSKIFA